MSHYCNIYVQKKTQDFRFRDLAALNAELRAKTAIGELLDEGEFIEPDGCDSFRFWDRESLAYGRTVNVFGCVGPRELAVIAQHIATGHLLLCMNHEGGPTIQFWDLSPNSVVPYTFPLPT